MSSQANNMSQVGNIVKTFKVPPNKELSKKKEEKPTEKKENSRKGKNKEEKIEEEAKPEEMSLKGMMMKIMKDMSTMKEDMGIVKVSMSSNEGRLMHNEEEIIPKINTQLKTVAVNKKAIQQLNEVTQKNKNRMDKVEEELASKEERVK